MTQQFDERIRAARYEAGAGFNEKIERTLLTLPPKKNHNRGWRSAIMGVAAAVVIVALIPLGLRMSLPKPDMQTLGAAEIVAMGMDEWVDAQVQLELPHANELNLNLETEFLGSKLILDSINLREGDDYISRLLNRGTADLRLRFLGLPNGDPNLISYSLEKDGKIIAANVPYNHDEYLKRDLSPKTLGDWLSSEFEQFSSAQAVMNNDGSISVWTSVTCPLWPWRISEKTELVLRGECAGESFAIPFTYDPAVVEADLVSFFREIWMDMQRESAQREAELRAFDEIATPVGIEGIADGHRYKLNQFAMLHEDEGAMIAFDWEIDRVAVNRPHDVRLNNVCIDGMQMSYQQYETQYRESDRTGMVRYITKFRLARDENKLPDTSIIELNIDISQLSAARVGLIAAIQSRFMGRGYMSEKLAFTYDWANKIATAPIDDAQRQAWLDSVSEIRTAMNDDFEHVYALSGAEMTKVQNGVRVTVTRAAALGSSLELYYTPEAIDSGIELVDQGQDWDRVKLIFRGEECLMDTASHIMDELASGFRLPVNEAELVVGEPITFDCAVPIYGADGQIRNELFTFDFTLGARNK